MAGRPFLAVEEQERKLGPSTHPPLIDHLSGGSANHALYLVFGSFHSKIGVSVQMKKAFTVSRRAARRLIGQQFIVRQFPYEAQQSIAMRCAIVAGRGASTTSSRREDGAYMHVYIGSCRRRNTWSNQSARSMSSGAILQGIPRIPFIESQRGSRGRSGAFRRCLGSYLSLIHI